METQAFAVDLTDGEREVLRRGLGEWGGPARCTDALAVVAGFNGVEICSSKDGGCGGR